MSDDIDCRTALSDMALVVDCECDDACRSRLERHLSGCPSCREAFLCEQRVKAMLSRSCCETAPAELRQRLQIQIRQTTVSTRNSDGTQTTRRTTVVRRTRSE